MLACGLLCKGPSFALIFTHRMPLRLEPTATSSRALCSAEPASFCSEFATVQQSGRQIVRARPTSSLASAVMRTIRCGTPSQDHSVKGLALSRLSSAAIFGRQHRLHAVGWARTVRWRHMGPGTFARCLLHGLHGPHRLVVRTSRRGRDNPGSTPGVDILAIAPLVDSVGLRSEQDAGNKSPLQRRFV